MADEKNYRQPSRTMSPEMDKWLRDQRRKRKEEKAQKQKIVAFEPLPNRQAEGRGSDASATAENGGRP